VLGLDHRILNGAPLDAYRSYMRRAWGILDGAVLASGVRIRPEGVCVTAA